MPLLSALTFFHHTAYSRGARCFRLRSAAPLAGQIAAVAAQLNRALVWSRPKVEKDGQNSARLLSGGRNAQLVEDARHILLRGAQDEQGGRRCAGPAAEGTRSSDRPPPRPGLPAVRTPRSRRRR